jgi:hypothetical protein
MDLMTNVHGFTHLEIAWTVILGELVVKLLVEMGRIENGDARRVRTAERSSLGDIGRGRGG